MQGAQTTELRRIRRNRMFMLIVLVCVLLLGAWLYVYMKSISAVRAEHNKQSFIGYVTEHKIGALAEIDSGTGLDPMSYVLILDHDLPDAQKASFATDMIHKYVQFDRGTALSIVYTTSDKKQRPLAETHYNRINQTVTVTIHLDSGQTQSKVESVNW